MEYSDELQKYGFSDKQAKIYLTLLKIGPSTVNQIAESADLVRTTTYDVLKSLKEIGVVGSTTKNNVQYFEASPPDKLISMLDERKKEISSILPGLKKLYKEVPDLPRSEVYDGKDGVKAVFQIILENHKPLCALSNNTSMLNLVPYFSRYFISERANRKIPIRIISEPSKTTDDVLRSKDKMQLRETRLMQELKDMAVNEYISEDIVAILGSRADEPFGIVIHSKDFAKEQKILFEKLWKIAEK